MALWDLFWHEGHVDIVTETDTLTIQFRICVVEEEGSFYWHLGWQPIFIFTTIFLVTCIKLTKSFLEFETRNHIYALYLSFLWYTLFYFIMPSAGCCRCLKHAYCRRFLVTVIATHVGSLGNFHNILISFLVQWIHTNFCSNVEVL